MFFQALYEQGGRKFWIHNTGPLGCLPQKISLFPMKGLDRHGCISSFNAVATLFNTALRSLCQNMRDELKDTSIVYVDIYAIKYDLIANSSLYGKFKPSLLIISLLMYINSDKRSSS